jgi:hypothetical protein
MQKKNNKNSDSKFPGGLNGPKKFNIKGYWIYIIVLCFFIGMQVFNYSKPIEKNWQEITDLAESGKIKELHLIKN